MDGNSTVETIISVGSGTALALLVIFVTHLLNNQRDKRKLKHVAKQGRLDDVDRFIRITARALAHYDGSYQRPNDALWQMEWFKLLEDFDSAASEAVWTTDALGWKYKDIGTHIVNLSGLVWEMARLSIKGEAPPSEAMREMPSKIGDEIAPLRKAVMDLKADID